ncbi:MAG: PspC domain-containing protein [Calditrichaeota bacterium]|nr:PspC domain-containing protein [Calditrichota bacterium]HQU74696.1 PspC domain-containing protein [Calditrichia bacterium]
MKRLYRSRTDQRLGGVIGGLAAYTNTDANLLRLLAAIFVLFTGVFPGIIVYFIAWFIVPEEPLMIADRPREQTPADDGLAQNQ